MLRIGSLVITALLLVGCRGYNKPPPRSQMVKGKVVSRDGRPIPSGRVNFLPLGRGGLEGWAEIRTDGTFGFQEGDGIPAGKYRVSVDSPALKADAGRVDPETVEVTEGTNEFEFKVGPG